jgi:hypothetical protein
MGDPSSLPNYLQPYYETCIASCNVMPYEIGKVCYLTVSEGYVRAKDTQRRGGIHVEAPGIYLLKDSTFVAGLENVWGLGRAVTPDELHGGIFMASTVDSTCAVWDALVESNASMDSHGGVDHLRPLLGEARRVGGNELIWMTDKTPHEALPQKYNGHRQYFRLVTSEISLWYEDHSTPNPKVPLPAHVKIIRGSKFDGDSKV